MSVSSPPPPPPPPPGGDVDRGNSIIAIYWVEVFVAIAIVSLRMYARYLVRNVGADDWMMVITLVFQITLAGFVTQYCLVGGARHLYYLTPPDMKQVLKWNYILQCWGIFAFTPAKVSVALLINRLMKPFRGWRFWVLVVTVTLMAIFNTLDSIFTYVQCNPAKALWDKTITDAKCWNPEIQARFSIFQGSYNAFVDVVLASIPATLLWKLTLPIKKKIGLCVLLGLGLLAAVAGSIKTSVISSLSSRSDLTWDMYGAIVLSGTENFVVLFCGSVPPIKPLWDKYISNSAVLASLHFSRGRTRVADDNPLVDQQVQTIGGSGGPWSKKSSISLSQLSTPGKSEGHHAV